MVSQHHERVRRALEGNERVYYHTEKPRIAVWHGGPQVTVYRSDTFEELQVFNVRVTNRSVREIEDAVHVNATNRGFERTGRTMDNTRVTEQ